MDTCVMENGASADMTTSEAHDRNPAYDCDFLSQKIIDFVNAVGDVPGTMNWRMRYAVKGVCARSQAINALIGHDHRFRIRYMHQAG